ncbi:hypothetical protein K474DRAFT_1654908 [Panus rudis PR-1116 ss-1]|nr:hypothetical protein K474DRAFT_1654908 [Panus rudis PR-1116 ss-1]
MELGPTFLKLRVIAFSCIIFTSFVWIVLLFVELYLRWDVSENAQRNLVIFLTVTNVITVILLPILIIVPFRIWLDTARLSFLLIAHIGTAIGFTVYMAQNPCNSDPSDTNDDNGVCDVINVYITLASWVVPTLLIAYSLCLGFAVYRKRQEGPSEDLEKSSETTAKKSQESFSPTSTAVSHNSILPILPPPPPPFPFTDRRNMGAPHRASTRHSINPSNSSRYSTSTHTSHVSRPSHRHMSMPAPIKPALITPVERQRKQSLPSISEVSPSKSSPSGSSPISGPSSTRSSTRLSKPIPQWTFEAI